MKTTAPAGKAKAGAVVAPAKPVKAGRANVAPDKVAAAKPAGGASLSSAPEAVVPESAKKKPAVSKAFLKSQRQRLLDLRDALLDQMSGVARDTLRSRAEGSEASAFGMHQADAGSDAYDRDFALNLLSQEQDSLYEIEEALRRVDLGTYGVCEMSGVLIPAARLEALPFARFTVECKEQLEQQENSGHYRAPVTSLFGLTEAETAGADSDDDN